MADKKIVIVITNHHQNGRKSYSIDIANRETSNISKSAEITEAQANAMILAGFEHEDAWIGDY